MKQLQQNMKNGKIAIKEIPVPVPESGFILIQNAYSLVSAGTERTSADFAEKNLLEKAASRPDLTKQVIEKAKREGIVSSLESALNRLDIPMYPGYSSAGKIIAIGNGVTGFRIGDRVACGGGNYAIHAEYCTVPKNLVVKIPDHVPFEEAAFTTLGSVAMHGIRLAVPQINETVLVIGLGLLGLLTIQISAAAGCRVLGIDISSQRVNLAQDLGCDACLRDEIDSVALPFTKGRGFDHVFICAGNHDNDTIELAGNECRDRGNVIAIGDVGLNIPRKIFYNKEIAFRVSRSYGPGRYDPEYEEKGKDYPIGYVRWTEGRNMEAFIDLLAEGKVKTAPLISHRIPIAEGEKAYEIIKGKTNEPYLGILIEYPFQNDETIFTKNTVQLREPSLPQPVNLGVIGAGNYANATFLPILKSAGKSIRLVTIVSNRGASAREAAEKFGFEKAGVNAETVLNDPDINTVVILTRHNLHSSMVIEALNRQKNVYCEKPLALDFDSLQAVYQAKKANPKPILMVGYNRRFAPLAVKLKNFLADCAEPLAMHYTVNAGFIPLTHWTQDIEIGGGRILGECCHMLDFMLFLTQSRPLQVNTIALPNNGRYQDDNVSIQVKFENGSIGTVAYLANGDKSYAKERLEVFGGGKIAILNDFKSLETWDRGNHHRTNSPLRIDKGHAASWQAFVSAIINGEHEPIPTEQLFYSSLTSLAAVDSLHSNEIVAVPDLNIFL